jgi:outer membrane protein assembly factor BamD (BamD/ComL family)
VSKAIILCFFIMIAGCVPVMHPSESRSVTGPEADFRKADSLEKEKKYPDAIAAYRKIIKDYPQSPVAADALFSIAHLQAFYDNPQRDYAQALVDYEDFEKRYPNHEQIQEAKNWETVLKLILDTKKENNRLRKSIEQLENIDIRHEENRRR